MSRWADVLGSICPGGFVRVGVRGDGQGTNIRGRGANVQTPIALPSRLTRSVMRELQRLNFILEEIIGYVSMSK